MCLNTCSDHSSAAIGVNGGVNGCNGGSSFLGSSSSSSSVGGWVHRPMFKMPMLYRSHEEGSSIAAAVSGGGASSSSGSKSTTFGGSDSSSIMYFPLAQSTVAAQIRAICARRYSFSVPGKGGYARTGAAMSPVKNLRMRAAATSWSGVTTGSSVHVPAGSFVAKYAYELQPTPFSSVGTVPSGSGSSSSAAGGYDASAM
mmetsp:Transcript_24438/g.60637  ORF Transcript_24438/g.60637 Transcript_24438/m.60637 type:complete len:200 (-) Transcript_24438:484-1083(-)